MSRSPHHDRSGHDRRRPGTGSRRTARASRRALRREVPSTVALLAADGDFTAMRGYRSFAFDDHADYLRQMHAVLRSLQAEGTHVSVVLFDPGEFADYCADTGQDPDTPASRTRYTAEVAAGGVTVPYQGQPVDQLVTRLVTETHRRTAWEDATDVLAKATSDPNKVFDRASLALMSLLEALGGGAHHLVCSVPVDDTPLVAVLHARCDGTGTVHVAEADALVFCTVLAAGIATDSPGGLVARSSTGAEDHPDRLRGWTLRDGWLQPLTEAEVFNAYCTDARTGEPVPPEPGVQYRAGLVIPPPGR